MRYLLILTISMILGISPAHARSEEGRILLKGTPLFSFNPDSVSLQTEKYLYQFSKSLLKASEIKTLEEAIVQNRPIEISLPNSSIEYFWPIKNEPNISSEKDSHNLSKQEVVNFHQSEIEIKGKSILSLSDPFYLLRSGNLVLQIKKSELNSSQNRILSEALPGNAVNIIVPNQALNLVWNYGQPTEKLNPAKIFKEKYSLENGQIRITGIMLLSQEEPIVLMQSNGLIFQLKKSGITTKNRSLLDSPGSHVSLRAPYKAVSYVWPAKPSENSSEGPESLKMNMSRIW